jgi:pimeloyl-ACP methyl ester carboxylesterase/DNA-binding SARP family transcriptional activator
MRTGPEQRGWHDEDVGSYHYRVFGELTVVDDEGLKQGVTGRNAQVLAVLLAAYPSPVTTDRLIEEVWGDEPPKAPETALHTVISRLRGLVGNDLVTTPHGYRIDAGSVDFVEFEEAAKRARMTEDLTDLEAAATAWSPDPFAGFDDLPSVRLVTERLGRVRERLTIDRLAKLVDRGRARDAIVDLGAEVGANPFNEETLALYMRALDGTGRKPEALAAFREYERLLAEETGLEPSANLRELEVAILTDQMEPVEAPRRSLVPLELEIGYVGLGDGRKLAVGQTGSGPPLLVHPGWLSKLDTITAGLDLRTPLWAELALHRRVVLFDRAGTGLSRAAAGEISLESSVAEVASVMRTMFDEPVPVLAGSAAGPLMIRAATTNPGLISHLVLFGTYASGPATFVPTVSDSMVALVRASWGMGSRVLTNLLFPNAPAEVREAFSTQQRTITDAETAAALLRLMFDADVSEDLPQLDVPCLVIHYRGDNAIPIRGGEQLAQGRSNSRYLPMDGSTHYPVPGDEPRIAQAIEDFLAL